MRMILGIEEDGGERPTTFDVAPLKKVVINNIPSGMQMETSRGVLKVVEEGEELTIYINDVKVYTSDKTPAFRAIDPSRAHAQPSGRMRADGTLECKEFIQSNDGVCGNCGRYMIEHEGEVGFVRGSE